LRGFRRLRRFRKLRKLRRLRGFRKLRWLRGFRRLRGLRRLRRLRGLRRLRFPLLVALCPQPRSPSGRNFYSDGGVSPSLK